MKNYLPFRSDAFLFLFMGLLYICNRHRLFLRNIENGKKNLIDTIIVMCKFIPKKFKDINLISIFRLCKWIRLWSTLIDGSLEVLRSNTKFE